MRPHHPHERWHAFNNEQKTINDMEIKDFETKMVGRRLIWTDTGREPGKQHGVFYIDRAEYSREIDKVQLYNQQQRVFAVVPSIVLALITTGRYTGEYKRGWDGGVFRKEYTLAEVSEHAQPHHVGVSLHNDDGPQVDATEMVRRLVGRRLRWYNGAQPPKFQHGTLHVDAVEVHATEWFVLHMSNGEQSKRAIWNVEKVEQLLNTGRVAFTVNGADAVVYTLEG